MGPPLLFLVVVAVLALGLRGFSVNGDSGVDQHNLTTPDNSDYYITDARVYQMGVDGRPVYRMTVRQTLHFPNGSARLSDIAVHYFKGTSTVWDITAARGRVPPGQRELYLYDGVEARHPRPGVGVLRASMDNAWIYPKKKQIQSQATVTAVEPGRTVQGRGLDVNLKTNTMKLLHDVHVTYSP